MSAVTCERCGTSYKLLTRLDDGPWLCNACSALRSDERDAQQLTELRAQVAALTAERDDAWLLWMRATAQAAALLRAVKAAKAAQACDEDESTGTHTCGTREAAFEATLKDPRVAALLAEEETR
jgi:hypothetical protein